MGLGGLDEELAILGAFLTTSGLASILLTSILPGMQGWFRPAVLMLAVGSVVLLVVVDGLLARGEADAVSVS